MSGFPRRHTDYSRAAPGGAAAQRGAATRSLSMSKTGVQSDYTQQGDEAEELETDAHAMLRDTPLAPGHGHSLSHSLSPRRVQASERGHKQTQSVSTATGSGYPQLSLLPASLLQVSTQSALQHRPTT